MGIKKIGIMSIAFTFAGCLLGAGYVSGQELWQYFGSYGNVGIIGLFISLIFAGICSWIVIWLSDHAETGTVDRLIIRFDIPWLRVAVGVIFSLLYFVITLIMIAGISSLCLQMFGIPRAVGSAFATILVMVTVYFGFNGMIKVFDLAVPVLVVVALVISVICIGRNGMASIDLTVTENNPLLGPWYMSAFNYMTLNMFGSIGIIAPLANHFKKKSTGPVGILIGTAALILIAVLLILAMATDRTSTGTDLPMLYMAQQMGSGYAAVYAALLFIAMYGNANATMVAALNYSDKRMPGGKNKINRIIRIAIAGVVAYVCSLTGFTNLVATVYPIIGYIGIATMILIFEHCVWLLRHKDASSKNT